MPDTSYVDWYAKERRQTWTTPATIFDPLHEEFAFTLDGAGEPHNSLLPRFITHTDIFVTWEGERVFCNPPWASIPEFVELAATAEIAVLLVPARTNTKWFHRALELGAEPRFFLGRPSFGGGSDNQKGHNSPVDCVLLVFNNIQEVVGDDGGATPRPVEDSSCPPGRSSPACDAALLCEAICDWLLDQGYNEIDADEILRQLIAKASA